MADEKIYFQDTSALTTKHALPLSPRLSDELAARGYISLEDLSRLSIFEAVRIPWINGADWLTITIALERKVFPAV